MMVQFNSLTGMLVFPVIASSRYHLNERQFCRTSEFAMNFSRELGILSVMGKLKKEECEKRRLVEK